MAEQAEATLDVLLVDPEIGTGWQLKVTLTEQRHNVIGPFVDVGPAIHRLRTLRPDAAIVASEMADVDRLAQALDRLGVPIVYLTDDGARRPGLPDGIWLPPGTLEDVCWMAATTMASAALR